MKKQRGITLIALIITIIVMLILVGVTVATISDGGIFQKAKTATEATEEKAIYEQLVGVIDFETNGKIKVKETCDAAETVLGGKLTYKSPSEVDETTDSATIEVEGKSGKKYTYTITTEKIMSGENKFYRYAYIYEDGEEVQEFYFMENGVMVSFYRGNFYFATSFEKTENVFQCFDGTTFILSSDCSSITDENVTLIRDDNKMLTFNSTPDETYRIYENAVYFSETTNDWFYTLWNEEEVITKIVCLYVGEFEHEFDYVSFNDFIEAGAVVSADGKQVTYNGITYTLGE